MGPTTGETGAKRILIVDNHPIVRAGLRALVAAENDLTVCAEAGDQDGALEAAANRRPDLVLTEITLQRSSGIDLIKRLRARHPRVQILVVTMHDERAYAARVLQAGANGFIMKTEPTAKLLAAIRYVLSGRTYLSEAMTQTAVDLLGRGSSLATSPVDVLSDRELQLFELTGRGKEIVEIAEIMRISPRTVEVHRSHIKKKLNLRSGIDFFKCAYEWLRETGTQP